MKILDEYEYHERKNSPSEPYQISGDPKYVLDEGNMVLMPIGDEGGYRDDRKDT